MADSDGISGAIKARLSSEILGTFSLSLMTCCWKIWIYAFSGESVATKILLIDDFLYSRQLIQAVVEALIVTLLILLILPKIKTKYQIWLLQDTTRLKIGERKSAIEYIVKTKDYSTKIKSVKNLDSRISRAQVDLLAISEDLFTLENELRGDSKFKGSLETRAKRIVEKTEEMKKWSNRLSDFENVCDELSLVLDKTASDAEKE